MLTFWVAVLVVIIDQLSKYYIQLNFPLGASLPVVPGLFHITYILNPGAAFGILENQRVFFIIIAIIMIGTIVYVYPRLPQGLPLLTAGIGLLVGGTIGNVIDRIQTGHVVDFFDFRVWPVFNIADIAICVGVAAIIYTMLIMSYKEDEQSG